MYTILGYIRVCFSEGTGPIADPLPIVFETTEDPTINNLTRNDINCDKTGTCYDGMALTFPYFLKFLRETRISFEVQSDHRVDF